MMQTFILHLQSPTQCEDLEIVSFVGKDSSGSFGLQANHARMMTCLDFGLSWFRQTVDEISYLALPGGLLYFRDNQLIINTRQYLWSNDYQSIVTSLDSQLLLEGENLRNIKDSLHHMDEEILKRLWELKRRESYG